MRRRVSVLKYVDLSQESSKSVRSPCSQQPTEGFLSYRVQQWVGSAYGSLNREKKRKIEPRNQTFAREYTVREGRSPDLQNVHRGCESCLVGKRNTSRRRICRF